MVSKRFRALGSTSNDRLPRLKVAIVTRLVSTASAPAVEMRLAVPQPRWGDVADPTTCRPGEVPGRTRDEPRECQPDQWRPSNTCLSVICPASCHHCGAFPLSARALFPSSPFAARSSPTRGGSDQSIEGLAARQRGSCMLVIDGAPMRNLSRRSSCSRGTGWRRSKRNWWRWTMRSFPLARKSFTTWALY